jgi:ribosome-binding factor A
MSIPNKPSYRANRLGGLVFREVKTIFKTEVHDERFENVNLTRGIMSADSSQIKVYFIYNTPVDEIVQKQTERALKKSASFIRKQLAKRLDLRRTPLPIFRYDDQHEENERLDKIFHKLAQNKTNDR